MFSRIGTEVVAPPLLPDPLPNRLDRSRPSLPPPSAPAALHRRPCDLEIDLVRSTVIVVVAVEVIAVSCDGSIVAGAVTLVSVRVQQSSSVRISLVCRSITALYMDRFQSPREQSRKGSL